MQKLRSAVLASCLAIAPQVMAQKTANAGAKAPTGTYTTTISKADLPADYPKNEVDSTIGKWSLTFAAGKPVMVQRNGKPEVTAPATFSDGKMSVDANDTGPGKCGIAAVYTFTEGKSGLIMKPVGSDQCTGRLVVLSKHPLKKSS